MSSPNLPNTLGIGQAIVALGHTINFLLTGGAVNFKVVTLGGMKDIAPESVPLMTVESLKDSSVRGGSGGTSVGWRIEETMQFRISLYVDYTVAANGEIDIITVRDATIPLFQTCIKLGNLAIGGAIASPQNVMDSFVVPNSGQDFYRDMGGGVVYRGYMFTLQVRQQYSVTVSNG